MSINNLKRANKTIVRTVATNQETILWKEDQKQAVKSFGKTMKGKEGMDK